MSVEKDHAENLGEDDEENNNGNANQKSPKVSQLLDSKLKDKHTPNQMGSNTYCIRELFVFCSTDGPSEQEGGWQVKF